MDSGREPRRPERGRRDVKLFMVSGPVLGLFIRQAVSRQREYLADGETVLLTRDPEGLALALTKIGGWRGPGRSRSDLLHRICALWIRRQQIVPGGIKSSRVTRRLKSASSF